MNVHIVTDSSAHFTTPHFLQQYPVTVVPNRISIDGKSYREGIDLTAEEALKLIATQPYAPLVSSPTEAQYVEVYNRLARSCDAIISIHASREIYPSWANAMGAARAPPLLTGARLAFQVGDHTRSAARCNSPVDPGSMPA